MTSEKRGYHHGRLRESLLESALDLARAGGPDAVTLRAVSRAAGVSHNAAYRHFADHDALMAAVAETCMTALADLMRQRKGELPAEADPVTAAWAELDAIGRSYIAFALAEPGWFRTAFASAGPPEGIGDDGPYELLAAALDRLTRVGAIPAERRPGAEFGAWSAVHGVSSLLLDGPLRFLPEAEREQAIEVVLRTVVEGL